MNFHLIRVAVVAGAVVVICIPALAATEGQNASQPKQLITRSTTPPPLYKLGPGDEITVHQENAEELNDKPERIDDAGFVNLPSIGRVQLAGLTLEEAEKVVSEKLGKLLLNPNPVISIKEYRSEPVSVFGAVNTPGVIQLQGKKSLIEVISLAGGVKADAGTYAEITRKLTYGPIPVKDAVTDGSGQYSTAHIDLAGLMKGTNPAANIDVFPQDVISVPPAEKIFVTGAVKKPGGFPVDTNGSYSVLQAVAMAEGVTPQAATKSARIMRSNGDGPRRSIPVNVAGILSNKESDFDMQPGDILFIPESMGKKIGARVAEAALQAATGFAIWHPW